MKMWLRKVDNGKKNETGSIALEATMVFPIFMLFIIFLIGFIRLASIQMALDQAVGDATKEIATHYYPIALLKDKTKEVIKEKTSEIAGKLTSSDQDDGPIVYITLTGKSYHTQDCGHLYNSKIPMTLKVASASHYAPCKDCKPPIENINKDNSTKPKNTADTIKDIYGQIPGVLKDYLKGILDSAKEKGTEMLDEKLSGVVKVFVLSLQGTNNDQGVLKGEQLHIRNVKIVEGEDIVIEATYEVKIPTPLGTKTIQLESKATEKTWK
ncbi:hypothetical protein DP73_03785 [Desulfosporosinus sp. HMP52]|uniref:TadE/TadG family type IV pilus assembly protein n=1 Tax=Desulfosporosinus sp. HMP52 TaxID=1487923 RepID=UPI00051FCA70|nr:TadE family protein [Desulfosporosinus sp. HMP52]KGK91396.1 hypothetical protein DP73_03785 [Desulfosporosinus sp. HMP52]